MIPKKRNEYNLEGKCEFYEKMGNHILRSYRRVYIEKDDRPKNIPAYVKVWKYHSGKLVGIFILFLILKQVWIFVRENAVPVCDFCS